MTSRRPGNPPQISIGLPVFNGERFIAEAIECVLSQTFGDFELVISDNASTDTTREICLAFCRQDPRVRYERNSLNVGAAPNFNRCFVLAQPSQYFKWMAYDDLMSDDFLERCIDALEQDPKASIAFPEMVHADSGGNVTERQFRKDLSLLDEEPGRRVQRLVQYGLEAPDIFWSIYAVMRRSAVEQTELHGDYVASDQVFLFELALAGKFVQVSKGLFVRRAHPGAWTMRTNRTPKSDAVWFGSRSRIVLPHWTLLRKHVSSVLRAPISMADKARCGLAIAYRARREWRALGGDVKLAIRELIARNPTRPSSVEGVPDARGRPPVRN